jgi:hypothetical protein
MKVAVPNGSNDNGDNDDDKNNNKNKDKTSVAQNHYRETRNFNPLTIVIKLQIVCKVKYSDFHNSVIIL